MAKLTVKNFSCLANAELEISDMTILIGPQASGKSVISKLVYFFYNILSLQYNYIEDEVPISSFNVEIEDHFKKWFPPSAWGENRFSIEFEAGPYYSKIARRPSRKKPNHDVSITFSDYFADQYTSHLNQVKASRERLKLKAGDDDFIREFDVIYRIRNAGRKRLSADMGSQYIDLQTFIPAGRSFFTSIGRAVTAFEQGGMLDPITLRFGRLFTNLRERGRDRYPARRTATRDMDASRLALMKKLFGGHIRFERDKEFVESDDGRKIPFSFLSSGQQELLPLWLALDHAAAAPTTGHLIYIEEPEAHLFPSAQDLLVEYISTLVSSPQQKNRTLITTHSPYVLSKFNNLLKAGDLSRTLNKQALSKLSSIVRKDSWLTPGKVKAYAILSGELVDIMGEDGLIDGNYLDAVSNTMGLEFSRLLELEAAN